MKRTIIALLCAVVATGLLASALAVANPWVESTSGDIAEAIGATFGVPVGAEDVAYSLMPSENLAEMRFTLDGMEYTARIKPSEEFDDISGMYYEWEIEEPCVIAFMQGLVKRATEEGETISLEEMLALPDFRLECAALRCTVTKVSGYELCYSLACGHSVSAPRPVRPGRNLWDVTETFSAWLKDRKQEMKITPVYQQAPWGMAVKDGSVSLQLTFTTSARLPELPMDRVRYDALYDASLSMLEEGSAFITRYDDTADSLMEAKLPLGVPYSACRWA